LGQNDRPISRRHAALEIPLPAVRHDPDGEGFKGKPLAGKVHAIELPGDTLAVGFHGFPLSRGLVARGDASLQVRELCRDLLTLDVGPAYFPLYQFPREIIRPSEPLE